MWVCVYVCALCAHYMLLESSGRPVGWSSDASSEEYDDSRSSEEDCTCYEEDSTSDGDFIV